MTIPKTISVVERAILSNQNRILAILNPEDSEHYNQLAEILEQGYSGLYAEVFEHILEGVSQETCEETFEILRMFRSAEIALNSLSGEQITSLNSDKLKFRGFDANNDSHYHFTEFLIKEEKRYGEFKDRYLNSHSSGTLPEYKKMLNVFKMIKARNSGSNELSYEDLKTLSEA